MLAGALPPDPAKALSLPEMFSADVMRRYTFVRLRGEKWITPSPKPFAYMSLDLGGKLTWAWMLMHGDEAFEGPHVSGAVGLEQHLVRLVG